MLKIFRPMKIWLVQFGKVNYVLGLRTEHIDRNFGVALSVWDWIFGTLCHSKVGEQLNFGLSSTKLINPNTLKSLYLDPIQEAGSLLLNFSHQLSLPFQRENSA